jgi:hypothetical protein
MDASAVEGFAAEGSGLNALALAAEGGSSSSSTSIVRVAAMSWLLNV